jgi:hypothetical protein
MTDAHDATRRKLVITASAAGAGLLLTAGNAGLVLAAQKGHGKGQGKEVGAVEDLMREHGVLRRALLVYSESVPKIRANLGGIPAAVTPVPIAPSFPAHPLAGYAGQASACAMQPRSHSAVGLSTSERSRSPTSSSIAPGIQLAPVKNPGRGVTQDLGVSMPSAVPRLPKPGAAPSPNLLLTRRAPCARSLTRRDRHVPGDDPPRDHVGWHG